MIIIINIIYIDKNDLWQNISKPLKKVLNTYIYDKKFDPRELMSKIRGRFVSNVI